MKKTFLATAILLSFLFTACKSDDQTSEKTNPTTTNGKLGTTALTPFMIEIVGYEGKNWLDCAGQEKHWFLTENSPECAYYNAEKKYVCSENNVEPLRRVEGWVIPTAGIVSGGVKLEMFQKKKLKGIKKTITINDGNCNSSPGAINVSSVRFTFNAP